MGHKSVYGNTKPRYVDRLQLATFPISMDPLFGCICHISVIDAGLNSIRGKLSTLKNKTSLSAYLDRALRGFH
jgi:hypothetical protein